MQTLAADPGSISLDRNYKGRLVQVVPCRVTQETAETANQSGHCKMLQRRLRPASEAGPLSRVQVTVSGLLHVFEQQQHVFVMLLFQAAAYQR